MEGQNIPSSSQNQERLNTTFVSLIEMINNNSVENEVALDDADDDDADNDIINNNEAGEEEEENNNEVDDDDDDDDDNSNVVMDDYIDEVDAINDEEVRVLNICMDAIKLAMERKSLESIQKLIDVCHDSDENIMIFKDKIDGNTIFHYACSIKNDDTTILKFILQLYNQHYSNTNTDRNDYIIMNLQNKQEDTILHVACCHGHIKIVQFIIEYFHIENSIICTSYNDIGMSPFHIACNKLALLKYFIHTCQINVDTADQYGNTIIHHASFSNDDNIISYLRTICHANEHALNNDGETALPYGYDYHLAATRGDLNSLIQCIQNGIDIEATDTHGYTALQLACFSGHLHIVDYLIQTCRVNVTTLQHVSGYNALHIACLYGHYNVVEYLLERNHIGVETTDCKGDTALHHACCGQHIKIVQYLIEKCHADIDVRNDRGTTILHCASSNGSLDILQYLTNHYELNANVQDKDGKTPLHLACDIGQMKIVQYLIKVMHANVNIKNRYGFTPILTAMSVGELSIVQYIIDECNNEIDLTVTTINGLDVFDFAIKTNKCNDFVLYILHTFSNTSK